LRDCRQNRFDDLVELKAGKLAEVQSTVQNRQSESARRSKIGNFQGEHMTDSNNQFERLEEKMLKAIELFKRTQTEKRALEQENEKLKAEIKEHAQGNSTLDRELIALRKEREDVRTRIEKLLERIDGLTSSGSEG
jgi:FtsZ-binding cell division protein ZapB